jgi:hypothetical protein
MLDEQTIATLNAMKLLGMAKGLEERLNTPAHAELSHAEFVGFLVQDEKLYRDNQRLKRLLKNAMSRDIQIPALRGHPLSRRCTHSFSTALE